jgi:hypothetical protein
MVETGVVVVQVPPVGPAHGTVMLLYWPYWPRTRLAAERTRRRRRMIVDFDNFCFRVVGLRYRWIALVGLGFMQENEWVGIRSESECDFL